MKFILSSFAGLALGCGLASDGVGKVLDYLDQNDLAKNTIVIYSDDNGWYLGDLGLYAKRFMEEPGLKVPLLARGPDIEAGSVPAQFVGNIDLAGLPVPAFSSPRLAAERRNS